MDVNLHGGGPIYEQVRSELRRLIMAGVYAPGDQLPTVRAMAQSLAVNPNTIQRAFRELEQEGLVYSTPGKGSFVADAPKAPDTRKRELLAQFDSAAQQLLYLGASTDELCARIRGKEEKA